MPKLPREVKRDRVIKALRRAGWEIRPTKHDMNPERFQNPAGRLLKIGQGDPAYWAFVPHSLPPTLTFDIELVRTLSDANLALGELSGLGRNMPNPRLLIAFIDPLARREAVISSRIEGTQADISDLYAYEAGQMPLTSQEKSDVREVRNYLKAMEYGLERLNTLPVSLRFIRELHEKLMEGVRGEKATPGEFRRSQNWLGPPGSTLNEATFIPPPVPEMHESLDALEKYLHTDNSYPVLMRLAFIHYQFETIHPFLDGNGRIGRLLIPLLLVHLGLLPLPLLYLSAFFERHRQDYYDLLLAVSERSAWRDWLIFFLRGVAEQARDAIARIKRLQDLQLKWYQQLRQAGASARLMDLADNLFKLPMLTIPKAQRILGVSYPGAKRNIEKLVNLGILKDMGRARYKKVYFAEEILGDIEN